MSDLEAIRERHRPEIVAGMAAYCTGCGRIWPCDTAQVLAALAAAIQRAERAEAALARLRGFLELTPHGYVGPERIPWFIHCGIAHAEGAECVVCAALAGTPAPAETPDIDVERLADLFMDLRLNGPAALADGWTYQQTARYYAAMICRALATPDTDLPPPDPGLIGTEYGPG